MDTSVDLARVAAPDVGDLHAVLTAARRGGPARGRLHPAMPAPEDCWHLTSYADVAAALRPDILDGRGWAELAPPYGPILLTQDGPPHTTLRRMIAPHGWDDELPRWRATAVADAVTALLDAITEQLHTDRTGARAEEQVVDLMPLLAELPLRVICSIMALDYADTQAMTCDLGLLVADPPSAPRSLDDLAAPLADVVAHRRRRPGDDLISAMTQTVDDDGAPLRDEDVVVHARQLIAAATETTMRGLGSMLLGLLADPSQWATVRAAPHLAVSAAREALRWETPLAAVPRRVTTSLRLGRHQFDQDDQVWLWLTAANRDPLRWGAPDTFDVRRPLRSALAFGFGPHHCLGAQLGLVEMADTLTALHTTWPRLRLADDPPPVTGLLMRGPAALRVHPGPTTRRPGA